MTHADEGWLLTTTGCPINAAIPQRTWTPITQQDRTQNAKQRDSVDDDEDKHSARLNTNQAQQIRSRLMGHSTARRLTTQLRAQGRRRDLDRLQEIRDPHVSRDW